MFCVMLKCASLLFSQIRPAARARHKLFSADNHASHLLLGMHLQLGVLYGDLFCHGFWANIEFLFFPNNLIFGLSEVVEGTFLKFHIFRQNFEFSNFRPDYPLFSPYLARTGYIFRWKLHIWVIRTTYLWWNSIYGSYGPHNSWKSPNIWTPSQSNSGKGPYLVPIEPYLVPIGPYLGLIQPYLGPIEIYLSPIELYLGSIEVYLGPIELYLVPIWPYLALLGPIWP